jgi:hypothetical protein
LTDRGGELPCATSERNLSTIRKYLYKSLTFLISAAALVLTPWTAKAQSTDGTIDFASQVNPVYLFGSPLSGSDKLVQLYWTLPGTTDINSFVPMSGSPAGFLTGLQAGFWDASSEPIVTTPGLAGGSEVLVFAKVFGGTIVDSTGNGAVFGSSSPILITTGNPGPPASISAMSSFSVIEAIPEPTPLVLVLAGGIATVILRRGMNCNRGMTAGSFEAND